MKRRKKIMDRYGVSEICKLCKVEPNRIYYLVYMYKIINGDGEGLEYDGKRLFLSGKALRYVAERLALRGKGELLNAIKRERENERIDPSRFKEIISRFRK